MASFLPLVWCLADFRALFWFGDEWDQLDQIASMGFWKWTIGCFGENFAPALKLSWGSLALGSHGSYLFMLVAVWLVHAAAIVLLGRWLLQAGFSAVATAFVLILFGWSATNIETVAWTIQLITIQGIVFFLAAGQWRDARDADGRWNAGTVAVFTLLVVLSTFSFVRGALTGASLIVTTLLLWPTGATWRSRLPLVLACAIPAAVSIIVIDRFAPGNHHHLAEAGFRAPAMFGTAYFLLNPFYNFFRAGMWTDTELVGYGAAKLLLLALGWWKATPVQRRLLLTLLAFDAGNAVLMGIGRYNQPLVTAASSRYQYISLACALPFAAVVLDWLLGSFVRAAPARRFATLVVLVTGAWLALHRWPEAMRSWADTRGRNTRDIVFAAPNPPANGAIPGIPFLTTLHAKELAAKYHLH